MRSLAESLSNVLSRYKGSRFLNFIPYSHPLITLILIARPRPHFSGSTRSCLLGARRRVQFTKRHSPIYRLAFISPSHSLTHTTHINRRLTCLRVDNVSLSRRPQAVSNLEFRLFTPPSHISLYAEGKSSLLYVSTHLRPTNPPPPFWSL